MLSTSRPIRALRSIFRDHGETERAGKRGVCATSYIAAPAQQPRRSQERNVEQRIKGTRYLSQASAGESKYMSTPSRTTSHSIAPSDHPVGNRSERPAVEPEPRESADDLPLSPYAP